MRQLFFTLGVLLGGIFIFSACSEEETSLGKNLLGTEVIDLYSVQSSDILVENQEDTEADLSKIATGLLGTLNDDVFGKTCSGIAFQVRLPGPLSFKKPEIDSVKLYLSYKGYYGADTMLMQNSRVFLLKNSIEYTKPYSSKTNIESLLGEEVGQQLFNKELASDTIYLKSKVDAKKDSVVNNKKQIDTVLQHLTIKLDNEKVGKCILSGTKQDFNSGADFIKFFKGLYVKTDDMNGKQGAIYSFNMYRSFIFLYYRDHATLSSGKDTIYNETIKLPITDNSARFNYPIFKHDKKLASKEKVYLQGINGTKAKVEMSALGAWKDSINISVNKAELIFKIATDSLEAKKYPLPQRLSLVAINKDGKKRFLNYSSLSVANLSGLLNLDERVYSFQIPEYLQSIIDGKANFDHFEISVSGVEQRLSVRNGRRQLVFEPVSSKNIPSRVVLYSSGENKPELKVTYTKY